MVAIDFSKYSPKNQKNDTGSSENQIVVFTAKINRLIVHLSNNKHDYCTKLSLDKLVNKRRKMLKYLKKNSLDRYNKIFTLMKSKQLV